VATRNWWISAEIDGRKTNLAGGPRAKSGGFLLRVRQRDNGASVGAVTLSGIARADGSLVLRIEPDRYAKTAGRLSVEADEVNDPTALVITTKR
jgi:hypothetical protein